MNAQFEIITSEISTYREFWIVKKELETPESILKTIYKTKITACSGRVADSKFWNSTIPSWYLQYRRDLTFNNCIICDRYVLTLSNHHGDISISTCYIFKIIVFYVDLSIDIFIFCELKQPIFAIANVYENIISYFNKVVDIRIIWNCKIYLERKISESLFWIYLSIVFVNINKILIRGRAKRNYFIKSTYNSERFRNPLSVLEIAISDCYIHGLINHEETVRAFFILSYKCYFIDDKIVSNPLNIKMGAKVSASKN